MLLPDIEGLNKMANKKRGYKIARIVSSDFC